MTDKIDLISSLQKPLEALQKTRLATLLGLGVTMIVGISVFIVLVNSGDPPVLMWIVIGVAFGISVLIVRKFKRTAAELIIPPLARTVGLRYQASVPKDLTRGWMATGLLPKAAAISRSEDGFEGDFAGRRFQTADLRIETGGKHSKRLFNGLVVSMELPEPHHAFVLASEQNTTGSFFARPKVGTENLVKMTLYKSSALRPFHAFVPLPKMADDPGFQARMQVLMRLDTEIGQCDLFSVVCTGRRMLVALSHETDFFRLRLLFGTANLPDDLRRVLAEMQATLKVVEILLESEPRATPDADAAPPKVSDAAPEAE